MGIPEREKAIHRDTVILKNFQDFNGFEHTSVQAWTVSSHEILFPEHGHKSFIASRGDNVVCYIYRFFINFDLRPNQQPRTPNQAFVFVLSVYTRTLCSLDYRALSFPSSVYESSVIQPQKCVRVKNSD